MSFMSLKIYSKGTLYSADCAKCGATQYAHEWVSDDPNGDRDAMQAGKYRCNDCGGSTDPETFHEHKRSYAGRYSADGYMDCTDWRFDTNKRRLARELRDMYGQP